MATDVRTPAQAKSIFSLGIQDLGTSDVVSTNVTRICFLEGSNVTANWSTAVNSLVLKNGSDAEVPGNFTEAGGEIIFIPTAPVVIPDDTTQDFMIEVVLNETGIVDGSVIQLSKIKVYYSLMQLYKNS